MMGEVFDVDATSVKVNAALNMTIKTSPPATGVENCRVGLELVAGLMTSGDYDTASKLLSALRTAATDSTVRDEVQRRIKEIESARKTAEQLGPALEKLKTSPNDPAANLAVGENLCFVQNNWVEGLPHLAKGSDAELKSLASRDQAAPVSPAEMTALGNDWWDAAAKREGSVKDGIAHSRL